MAKDTTSSQRVYYVNCSFCGEIVKVVNPKLTKNPTRISLKKTGQASSKSVEQVATKCSACKNALVVYLTYRG